MKCDAGEIACAIDRLTDAVQNTGADGAPTAFDWLTRVVIPVALSALTLAFTLFVALGSQRIAKESNLMNARAREEERENRRFRDRVEVAEGLRELLEARRGEALRRSSPGRLRSGLDAGLTTGLAGPSGDEVASRIGPKVAVSPEPGATVLLRRVNHFFDGFRNEQTRAADLTAHARAVYIKSMVIEGDVRTWTESPSKFLESIRDDDLPPLSV